MNALTIGVLAMQGAFVAHARAINLCGHKSLFVKNPNDLDYCDGLILPGGESTTQIDLINRAGLNEQIRSFAASKKPIFGTCAGVILLVNLKIMNLSIKRNAYGSQKESFETFLDIPQLGSPFFKGIFIRAPQILEVPECTIILSYFEKQPVLVKKENFLAATFHPELTPGNSPLHRMLLAAVTV